MSQTETDQLLAIVTECSANRTERSSAVLSLERGLIDVAAAQTHGSSSFADIVKVLITIIVLICEVVCVSKMKVYLFLVRFVDVLMHCVPSTDRCIDLY